MIYEFTPTQDLHGYSEPWAPGAGGNLAGYVSFVSENAGITVKEESDGSFIVNGTTTIAAFVRGPFVAPDLEATYSWALFNNTARGEFSIRQEDVSPAGGWKRVEVTNATHTFTIEEDKTPAMWQLQINSDITLSNAVYKPMIVLGSTPPTAYLPYSNICPLEGYNIWDPSQDQMIPVYSGYVDANANKLYLHPVYEEYDGEELVGPWMSSMDKYTEEGTPTTGAFVVDFGGEVTEYDITDFMLQTLLDSLGVRRFIMSGAMLLNSLMDQAQGRVRSEEELLNRSLPLHVIAIGADLPTNLVIKKPISDVLPGLPGKTKI